MPQRALLTSWLTLALPVLMRARSVSKSLYSAMPVKRAGSNIDHFGELRSFPNAKIFVNADELGASELQGIANIEPVHFSDGAYYNFPESQRILDGITFIKAKGHTNGNSIVVVEDASEGLFYMIHGDITYTDEALYENKLSVVFDDLAAARETMDHIREFVSHHPTVYLSTHTPLGPENLERKAVVDLSNPPETIPLGEVTFKTETGKYVCSVCGYEPPRQRLGARCCRGGLPRVM